MSVGDAYLIKEHLIEGGSTGHLPEWSNLYPGGVHVYNEDCQAFVLRHIWVRTADDFANLGQVRSRCPDLLSAHNPLVTVSGCFHRY